MQIVEVTDFQPTTDGSWALVMEFLYGEELRARFPQMPIAIATANVQDEVVARAHAANATFIAKPVTEEGIRGFLSGAALRLRAAAQ